MDHELDVELSDAELDSEIRMVAELMVAAESSTSPLDQRTIDQILLCGPESG